MKLVKTPKFVSWWYPKRIWAFSKTSHTIYLTFDDGPIPEVTPWVLDVLKGFNAKATFFFIGDNVRKHPDLFKRIVDEGHTLGNHTYHHLKGTKTKTEAYLKDVVAFEGTTNQPVQWFRPPYGKMRAAQARGIQKRGYTIVMWSILSYDWDSGVSEEQCLENVQKHLSPGSIVVFHDSLKAEKNLRYALPRVLESIREKGWNVSGVA